MDVFYITVKFYFKICQFVGYTQKTFMAPKKEKNAMQRVQIKMEKCFRKTKDATTKKDIN